MKKINLQRLVIPHNFCPLISNQKITENCQKSGTGKLSFFTYISKKICQRKIYCKFSFIVVKISANTLNLIYRALSPDLLTKFDKQKVVLFAISGSNDIVISISTVFNSVCQIFQQNIYAFSYKYQKYDINTLKIVNSSLFKNMFGQNRVSIKYTPVKLLFCIYFVENCQFALFFRKFLQDFVMLINARISNLALSNYDAVQFYNAFIIKMAGFHLVKNSTGRIFIWSNLSTA
eukprot:TRINITY_DN4392_c1_g1_i1.p1 TRINITY_DN4392_c1_g1~~TRINITY_DN4392_c1_g1_i1.p1  ORF type:complete len:233 (-),score=-4.08 TRINITY_DN4392_c1_g1_i1:343-1041(-)